MNKATQPQRMEKNTYHSYTETYKHTDIYTPSLKIKANNSNNNNNKCYEGKIETIASQAVVMMHYTFRFLLIFLCFMFYSKLAEIRSHTRTKNKGT